jgi:hypothetical protein
MSSRPTHSAPRSCDLDAPQQYVTAGNAEKDRLHLGSSAIVAERPSSKLSCERTRSSPNEFRSRSCCTREMIASPNYSERPSSRTFVSARVIRYCALALRTLHVRELFSTSRFTALSQISRLELDRALPSKLYFTFVAGSLRHNQSSVPTCPGIRMIRCDHQTDNYEFWKASKETLPHLSQDVSCIRYLSLQCIGIVRNTRLYLTHGGTVRPLTTFQSMDITTKCDRTYLTS